MLAAHFWATALWLRITALISDFQPLCYGLRDHQFYCGKWSHFTFHSLVWKLLFIYRKKNAQKNHKSHKIQGFVVCFFQSCNVLGIFSFFFCYYVLAAAAATVKLCISTLWPAVRTKCDAFPPVTPWSNPPTCTPQSGSGTGRTRSPSGTCTLWVVGSHTSVKVQQFTVFSSNFLPVSPAFDFPFLFVKSAEVSSVKLEFS